MAEPAREEPTKIPEAGPPLWAAFVSPDGAVLLGAAVVTAAATHLPLFLGLGAIGYGILAFEKVKKIKADRAAERELAPYKVAVPPVDRYSLRAKKLGLEGYHAAQAVLDDIAAAPSFVKELFQTAVAGVRDLWEKHETLVRKIDDLDRYFASVDVARLSRECEALERKIKDTPDAQAREQFQAALATYGESLASHADLVRDAKRIEAQLAAIKAGFEAARAKIVRVRSAEARGAAGEGEAVAMALEKLGGDVQALSSAVDEVFVRTIERQRKTV